MATRCFSPPESFRPALADLRAVTAGHALDEVVYLRQPRRLVHFGVRRIGAAVANVVADRVVEQHRVLRDHADRPRAGDCCVTASIFWPSMVIAPEAGS